ncbi:MAG: RnfABCDGE type electron transport complex subunit D [Oscillospiraceae bacterium]
MNKENSRRRILSVASAPHIGTSNSVRGMMLDVLFALVPALCVSVYFFGPRALLLVCVTVASCVLSEYLYRRLLHLPGSVGDLSAAVTGGLLAMCLPVTTPWYLAALAGGFAIVVVKQLFGGLGKNFLNPALLGRLCLFSFPVVMSTFGATGVEHWVPVGVVDTVSTPTPLSFLHGGSLPQGVSLREMFLGQRGGSLGEIAAFALILGGLYLVARGVIRLRIPLCFLGTVAVLTFLFPQGGNDAFQWMSYELLSGGLMLGAIFMATDPVTSPITPMGQVLYGIGCGALTVLLRYFGPYPEGVCGAILGMNMLVWALDKISVPRRFGTTLMPQKSGEVAR